MINRIAVALACCLPLPGFAQPNEQTFQIGAALPASRVYQAPDNSLVFAVQTAERFAVIHSDAAWDARLTTLFEGLEIYNWSLLLPSGGGLVATAAVLDCDDGPLRRLIGLRPDSSEWSVDLETFPPLQPTEASLLPSTGNRFWLFRSTGAPLRFDVATGQPVDSAATGPQPTFRGYLTLGNDEYLTYGAGGLRRYAPDLTLLSVYLPGDTVLAAERMASGDLVCVTPTHFYRLNADGSSVATSAHGLPGVLDYELSIYADGVTVFVKSIPRRYVYLDENMQPISTGIVPADELFQPQAGGFGFRLGSELDRPVTAIRSGSGLYEPGDAAVELIEADSAVAFDPPSTPLDDWKVRLYNVRVTVRNVHQFDTLHSVALNGDPGTPPSAGCAGNEFHYRFTGLNVGLFHTTVLAIGDVELYHALGPAHFTKLCVWSSLPSGRLDADHGNDQYCEFFPVTLSLASEPRTARRLRIEPNPAVDFCLLQWDRTGLPDTAVLTVYDAMGRLLRRQAISGDGYRLERGDLPPGLYHCVVQIPGSATWAGRVSFGN
jgi:hypothetical protein